MNIITSSLLESTGILRAGVSTRHGGVSPPPFDLNMSFNVGDDPGNVEQNRELFFRELGIQSDRVAFAQQVHSKIVKRTDKPGKYSQCDGLVTDVPGLSVCISVADCIPVLIVETKRRVVAGIHAGWRGTADRIVQEGIRMMIDEYSCSPAHMKAYIGPGAGACCYAVGEEVATRFDDLFIRKDGARMFVDLKAANRMQLMECGVQQDAIETSPHCTIDNAALFHSFRREKERSGRMLAVIGLKPR